MKSQVGRAELLVFFDQYGADHLAEIADCFGFIPPAQRTAMSLNAPSRRLGEESARPLQEPDVAAEKHMATPSRSLDPSLMQPPSPPWEKIWPTLRRRAELLVFFDQYEADCLAGIAHDFGFIPPARRSAVPSNAPSVREEEESARPLPEPEKKMELRPAELFYYLSGVKRSDLLPEGAEEEQMATPAWLLDPNLTQPPSPIPGRDDAPPPWQALAPWEKIWPTLHRLLSVMGFRSQPDIDRLVGIVAEGRFPQVIPWHRHRGWAASAIILYDYCERLRLFGNDYHKLSLSIERLRGETGLQIMQLVDRPGGKVRKVKGNHETVAPWRMPVPDETVLVLSDAGLLDRSGLAYRQWLAFGKRLRGAGCLACLLTPLPPRYLTAELASLFHCVYWSRQSDLQRVFSPLDYHEVQRVLDADLQMIGKKLLPWLSPSSLVEPGLLRALCRLLGLDTGIEALVRIHGDVQANTLGLYVHHDRMARYRKDLDKLARQNPTLTHRVYELFKRYHARRHPTKLFEEVQVFSSTGAIVDDDWTEAAELHFKRLVKELIDGNPAPDRAESLQNFGFNFLQRYTHRALADRDYLSSLWAVLKKKFEGNEARPPWLQPAAALPLLSKNTVARKCQAIQQGERLLLTFAPVGDDRPGAGLLKETSPLFSFESTTDLVVEEVMESNGMWRTFDHSLGRREGLYLLLHREPWRLHVNGLMFALSAMTLPAWAEAIGRDGQGLFVDFRSRELQFRSYWQPPTVGQVGQWQGFPPGDSGSDRYGIYTDITVKGVTQRCRLIEAGMFRMGSPENERGRWADCEAPHPVILSRGFWLADTAVTQALWQAVMGDNPAHFQEDAANPVEKVSWRDARKFIDTLNGLVPGLAACLPSEAQWEYACRAGSETPFSFGNDITPEQVNYNGRFPYGWARGLSKERTVPVKSLPPNPWGLYEMHGNVWEWCADVFVENLESDEPVIDPLHGEPCGWGADRVVRGGSWLNGGRFVRSATRNRFVSGFRNDFIGFRLAIHAEGVRSR